MLLDALAEPFQIDDYSHMTSACIGIATGLGTGMNASEALKQVDLALTSAKQSGRNGYLFFDPELRRRTEERVMAIGRVQDALDRRADGSLAAMGAAARNRAVTHSREADALMLDLVREGLTRADPGVSRRA